MKPNEPATIQSSLWGEQPTQLVSTTPLDLATTEIDSLSNLDWSFTQSTERNYTHGLHPWPAKFIPDIPAAAISILSKPGDIVLDPFCGCGTTALEALRLGRGFIAADINPLAVKLTEGKCEVPGPSSRLSILEWARGLITQPDPKASAAFVPAIPNMDYWFDECVVGQLASIRKSILDFGGQIPFLETIFSSIIVAVSHQESETRYRRVAKDISADDVLARFQRRLYQGLTMAASLDEFQSAPVPKSYLVADARALCSSVSPHSVQLAVFSPPYPNSFDYHLYHRFRMFWLGMDPRTVKHNEIGAHLRYQPDHTEWLRDMTQSLIAVKDCLVPGGSIVTVVGDGIVRGEIVPSADLLWDVAASIGLRCRWRVSRPVALHRKAFNLSDSRLKSEHVLVLQA